MSIEMIDKMKGLKDVLNTASAENAEDMIKHLTEDEKDCLLSLYVYENK